MIATNLKEEWVAFKEANPRVRIRDAAKALNVSEAELLATNLGGSVVRLRSDWFDMLMEMERFGEVMALTRNEVFVHEKVGRYSHASVFPEHKMGQTLDKNIDLRIFFRNWHVAFAVTNRTEEAVKRSLQYFDKYGNAVHKTHFRPESDYEALDAFIEKYRHEDQVGPIEITPPKEPISEKPDDEIDRDALREAWASLKDTHDFIFMLRKFKVGREQAFRIAGSEYAKKVDRSSFNQVLERASEAGLSIMIFVNNPGCVQIHSGPVHKLKTVREWYNILDPGFNLHVKHHEIASTWVVKKGVETGHVHSLECLDEEGQALCYIFSKRKEGEYESEQWREIVHELS